MYTKIINTIIAITLLTGAAAAMAQPTYPLMCRSGGTLQLAFDSGSGAWARFAKGTSGYTQVQLQPGQCAWADRALSANEPSSLNQPGVTNINLQWGNDFTAYGNSTQASWLRALTEDGEFVTFQAYNNGSTLIVTSFTVRQ